MLKYKVTGKGIIEESIFSLAFSDEIYSKAFKKQLQDIEQLYTEAHKMRMVMIPKAYLDMNFHEYLEMKKVSLIVPFWRSCKQAVVPHLSFTCRTPKELTAFLVSCNSCCQYPYLIVFLKAIGGAGNMR